MLPKISFKCLKKQVYQKVLLALLGVTGVFCRFNIKLPTKWYSLIDTLQVSTSVLHTRLSVLDREVQREYQELETNFERQLGITSFYCPNEIEEIKDEIEELNFQQNNMKPFY